MKVVIGNRKIDFDELFLGFLILNLLVLVFINEGQLIIELLITVFAFISIIQLIPYSKSVTTKVLLIGGVFLYLFTVTIINGCYDYVDDNIRFLLRPALVLIYLSNLMHQKPQLLDKIIFKHCWVFNIYYFLNFLMMLYQIKLDVFYDNITGFIGRYGTHRLTAFVCFLLLLNIQAAQEAKSKRKICLLAYTGFLLVSTLWISSFNDNTAVYVMLPITVILYLFCTNKISMTMLIKIVLTVLVILIAFDQLMKVEEIRHFLEGRLFLKIDQMFLIFEKGKMQEERFVYITYALDFLNGKGFGVGLGMIKMIGDKRLSSIDILMRNWGMSNMASLIAIGGIIFMFIYVVIYGYIVSTPSNNVKRFVSVCIIFLMLFYYGQTATSIPMITVVWMMLYPFFRYENINKITAKEVEMV